MAVSFSAFSNVGNSSPAGAGTATGREEIDRHIDRTAIAGGDRIALGADVSAMQDLHAAAFTPAPATLSTGSTGDAVKALQQRLGVKADGVFGPQTERALKAFQSSHGLRADGVFGPKTLAALQPSHATQSGANARLGSLSTRYETGGHGPGTVSSGRHDPGGVSYGSYQLATNRGRPQEFLAHEGKAWAQDFAGQTPGTPEFSATWKRIAARDPQGFQAAQHAYIVRTHYDVQAAKIQTDTGLDLLQHSDALRQAVWSTAVQHGPSTSVVDRAIRSLQGKVSPDSPDYDRHLIAAIYDRRTQVHPSDDKRYVNERADALAMLGNERSRAGAPLD